MNVTKTSEHSNVTTFVHATPYLTEHYYITRGLLPIPAKLVKWIKESQFIKIAQMYGIAFRIKELWFYTRVTKDFRSDLHWWHMLTAGMWLHT